MTFDVEVIELNAADSIDASQTYADVMLALSSSSSNPYLHHHSRLAQASLHWTTTTTPVWAQSEIAAVREASVVAIAAAKKDHDDAVNEARSGQAGELDYIREEIEALRGTDTNDIRVPPHLYPQLSTSIAIPAIGMQYPGEEPTDFSEQHTFISHTNQYLYGFRGIIESMFDNNVTDFEQGVENFALSAADSLEEWMAAVIKYVGDLIALAQTDGLFAALDSIGSDLASIAGEVFDLDNAVNFFAGWADALTGGLHGKLRKALGIDGGVDYNSGAYMGGTAVGILHGMALGAGGGAKCVGGWAVKAAAFYEKAMTVHGIAESLVNVANGEAGIGDLLNFAPAAGSLLGRLGRKTGIMKGCFVADTPVARGWGHEEVVAANDDAGSMVALVTLAVEANPNRWQTTKIAGGVLLVIAMGYAWHREARRKKEVSEDNYFARRIFEDLQPLRQTA